MDTFRDLPGLRTPEPPEHIRHAWYRVYTFIRPERLKQGWDRDRIVEAINAAGVACFTGSCPEIYREKAFVDAGFQPAKRLADRRLLGETSLAFLVDPCQDAASMRRVADVVATVMRNATKEREPAAERPQAVAANSSKDCVRAENNARNRTDFVGGQASRTD